MGRFDEKYSAEVKAELCRLVLDAKPRRSVPQALAEIAESHGVEINRGTADSYVAREKMRRRAGNDSPLPVDPHEALDAVSRKLIVALDTEARRIIRAAGWRGKPLDVDRLRTAARTVKELRALGRSRAGRRRGGRRFALVGRRRLACRPRFGDPGCPRRRSAAGPRPPG